MTSGRLSEAYPDLDRVLTAGTLPPRQFAVSQITCKTLRVPARDGTHLATDLYLPPLDRAPVVAVRTPYDRSREDRSFVAALLAFARRGYIVASQDCRGTGDSDPDSWDYYVFEPEDSYDFVSWIVKQPWYDGFICSFGSSYVGQTQWCMARHVGMSAIVPGMSGLGIAVNTAHLHMFVNAYARSVGKGADKIAASYSELERLMIEETLSGGYFNEPLHQPLAQALHRRFPRLRELSSLQAKHWLWEQYCGMTCPQRAEFVRAAVSSDNVTIADIESLGSIFGQEISHDRHTLPFVDTDEMCRSIHAPPLLRTGWYDWGLNDALATWHTLRKEGQPQVAARARMIITPLSHNTAGYKEGMQTHPELTRVTNQLESVGLLMRWYAAVREQTTQAWPTVTYYLMGANEWHVAADWPVPEAQQRTLFLDVTGLLRDDVPCAPQAPVSYTFDPGDPPPTVGGSILSSVYSPGSVDVREVQQRADVLVFTTGPLEEDVDVVGPLRLVLYASSSAVDTDFVGRLSDVFPDGRAVQLQNGILRTRYRDLESGPQLLEPGRIYRLEIDMWATANRFKAGHRLRIDVSSADFPRFDRNTNRGGEVGPPMPARQTVYCDSEHPSHFSFWTLPTPSRR